MGSPRVTVFMPAYNREAYVARAVESVLAQSYRDFELLVIDDGSLDATASIVAGYDDPRIRLVCNETNLGIPRTRNLGTRLARGEYLAMLDTDDLASPSRLRRQVHFLDANPDVAAVGSWAWKIDGKGRRRSILERPVRSRSLRARLLFRGCLRTPSAMARRSLLERYPFRDDFPVCSDSDVWTRIALDHPCANLPLPLISYRIHGGAITKSRRDDVREAKGRVTAHQLERLGVAFEQRDLDLHFELRKLRGFVPDADYLEWAGEWLPRLRAANARRGIYPEPEFSRAVAERWVGLLRRARQVGQPRPEAFRQARRRVAPPHLCPLPWMPIR
jgi:glycosyltransferase involved in cell wall biosynthesis